MRTIYLTPDALADVVGAGRLSAAAPPPQTVALVDPRAVGRDLEVHVDGWAVTVCLATAPHAATLGAGDAAVTFTTSAAGVTVDLADPDATDHALAVVVDGSAGIVTLATDAAGNVTTTAADVVTAVNDDQAASALVTAALPAGSDGTGVVAAVAATALAGGGDVTTTAADVVTAVNDDQAASALVTAAALPACPDAGIVAPAAATRIGHQATLGVGSSAVTFASVPPYDAARVQRALDDVADRIDGRIRRRYAVPLEDVPGFLSRAAAWCALGVLVDETTGTDLIAARAEEGWQLVADIASGKIRIGGDLDGDPGANAPTRAGRAVLVYRNSPFAPTNTKGII